MGRFEIIELGEIGILLLFVLSLALPMLLLIACYLLHSFKEDLSLDNKLFLFVNIVK